jgi:hypothetical protein
MSKISSLRHLKIEPEPGSVLVSQPVIPATQEAEIRRIVV